MLHLEPHLLIRLLMKSEICVRRREQVVESLLALPAAALDTGPLFREIDTSLAKGFQLCPRIGRRDEEAP
jgi:hypothetical protein